MLFSEPKIPHPIQPEGLVSSVNVSVLFSEPKIPHSVLARAADGDAAFQCSSASRKFLTRDARVCRLLRARFSALQRAENSSPTNTSVVSIANTRFSALQRAENSSLPVERAIIKNDQVSVLFSEPKIPHRAHSIVVCLIR